MSAERVEIVRSLTPSGADLVELLSSAGLAATGPSGVMDPEFESVWISDKASSPTYRGIAGMQQGWRDWLEAWSSYVLEAEEFLDAGDSVVVLVRLRGRVERGGVEIEHDAASVWTFSGDRIVRIEFHLERDEALRRAGLAPGDGP